VEYNRIKNNQALLNKKNFDYIRNLPFAYEFYLSGNLIRIFHATPTSEFGFINDYDTNMQKREYLREQYRRKKESEDKTYSRYPGY
jgi:hypothetical protein